MKRSVWIVLALAGIAFAQNDRPVFEIGRKLSTSMLQFIPRQLCLTASSRVEACVTVRLAGVVYRVGFSAKDKSITYLETHDPAFVSDLGLRVGDIVEEDASHLSWSTSFGEAVAFRGDTSWTPVVGFDPKIPCVGSVPEELDLDHQTDSRSCRVRVLAFKKRIQGSYGDVRASLPITAAEVHPAP